MTAGQILAALGVATIVATSQAPATPLFFREDWTTTPAALPVTQDHVATPGLVLKLLGPGAGRMKKSHHDRPADDPYYVWSGEAEAGWVVSLSRPDAAVDLTVPEARVRWRARQTGFRRLHLVVQIGDASWLVSDQSDDASESWREHEFSIRTVRWRELDVARVVEGDPAPAPDLTRVLAIGFTDLMRGGGTPASSRLDWIAVYGRPVPAAR